MLEDLRDSLNALDRELLEVIARRQSVVEKIGERKRAAGLATRDFAREKTVIEKARSNAEALGLAPELAESVFRCVIEQSLRRQEQDAISHSSRGADQKALIIGGCGQMGRWFARFLASQSYAVSIADQADAECPWPRVDDWTPLVDDFDLIVVATPIQVSASILRQLVDLKPRATIFDLASLKSPLRQPLRALADAGLKVTSLHPMFGPDTQLLSGRHVIFVDVGNAEANRQARNLFEGTMARLVDMNLEDHDRMVAYVLGLSHALNIAFFTALRESGEASEVLADLSSTTFDAQLAVAGKVASENPSMYFEIQSLNDYRLAPLNALHDALGRLKDLISRSDEAGFVQLMQKGHDYLSKRQDSDAG